MHIGAEGNSVATDKDRMSDDEAGQEDSEVTPPRRTSKLKMAIGALVVVGCAGAGAFVSLGTNLLGGGMTSTTSAPDSFLPLAELTVNIGSSTAVMLLRLALDGIGREACRAGTCQTG